MKRSNQRLWHILGCIALAHLTACSFGGSEETPTEEVAATEGEVAEAPPAPEGAETELPNPSDAAAEATAGATDPMATGSDAAVGDIPPELLGSIPSPTEGVPGAEGSAGETAAPEGGLAPAMDAGAGMEAGAGMGMPAPAAAEATSPAPADAIPMAAPSGDTRVYYVSASGASVKDKPDSSGQTVGQLLLGDPVLVKIEGNWANIVNRGWVEVASLSMNPVGRSKPTKTWN